MRHHGCVRAQLIERLRDAGISPGDVSAGRRTPWAVWLELSDRGGRRVTLVDLYDLEATRRGVAVAELPAADRQAMAHRVLAVQYPGWEVAPGGGFRAGEPVEIAGYDGHWPELFGEWRRRLGTALGDVALRVDHVGSTAVPGLAAKPVIDVQVSVDDLEDEPEYVPAIESTGVVLQSREHARRYFRPPPGRPRTVQVHVCAAGSEWERDHLLFRDYLRAHDEVRDAYAALKRELARCWGSDRLAYTGEKTAFILGTLEIAESWAANQPPDPAGESRRGH